MEFRFCPSCGEALVASGTGRVRKACPSCDFVHYGEWRSGVGGVVVRDGRVVLARRAIPPAMGSWAIPGGYVERAGLVTEIESVCSIRSVVFGDHHDTYVVFRLGIVGGELRADGIENDDVGFFSPSELVGLEGLTPFSRILVEKVLASASGLPAVAYRRPDGNTADCYAI